MILSITELSLDSLNICLMNHRNNSMLRITQNEANTLYKEIYG